jgi:hypothetical protein
MPGLPGEGTMKEISSTDAIRELTKWNTNNARFGCIYTVSGNGAILSARHGNLRTNNQQQLFIDSEDGKAMMNLRDNDTCAIVDSSELPFAQRKGSPPLADKAIKVIFSNKDVCFIFPEA